MQIYSLYCDFKCGKMQRSIVVIGLGTGAGSLRLMATRCGQAAAARYDDDVADDDDDNYNSYDKQRQARALAVPYLSIINMSPKAPNRITKAFFVGFAVRSCPNGGSRNLALGFPLELFADRFSVNRKADFFFLFLKVNFTDH